MQTLAKIWCCDANESEPCVLTTSISREDMRYIDRTIPGHGGLVKSSSK